MTCTQFYNFIKKQIGKGGATFRKFCGMTAGAWCCAYVTWNFHKTGNKALFYGGKKVVYCPTAIKWCMAFLAQIPMYLAMPGDIIFFDWNKNKVPDHIGHVKKHKSNSSILTHEGNTNGGVVAEKERPAKYVLGVFRPHFKPPKDVCKKKLELDGDCGYYTIWNLEIALGLKPTGILSKAVVKALQRKAGATPDGAWLVKTSIAVQRMTGAKPDGDFFTESVKALQGWINKVNGYTKKTTVTKKTTTTSKVTKPAKTSVKTPAKVTNAQKIVNKAKELAWAYGTDKKKYAFKTGAPKAVCKEAMKKYGWADSKSEMSDCGNVASTIVRESGVSKSYKALHGIKTPFPKKEEGFDLVLDGKKIPKNFLEAGDNIRYKKKNGKQHTLIYMGDGKICEGSHKTRFAVILKDNGKYNKVSKVSTIQVLRPKE